MDRLFSLLAGYAGLEVSLLLLEDMSSLYLDRAMTITLNLLTVIE